ncbi:M20/M25/M40 family metallo-hydrolase, partial [Microbacterium sp. B24]|uniref:M20/M25/M40 family metallo-hydrolase n=1 Tax=Microbacterium sp. B24 TaxID=95616 RepID=UPI0005662116
MSADTEASIARFRELLQIPTVSHADESLVDADAFTRFIDTLARLYPTAHAALEREVVDGYSLLFRWSGRQSAADPLVLMAHMDVVPVVDEEWDHPPFGAEVVGEGVDAEIHARGAIDDKGALVAIMEAVEELAAEGYAPTRDVYLAS